MTTVIGGSIVALVTPMTDSCAVDWDALASLIEWHIEEGTDAVVPVGTTGEAATLTRDEHLRVIAETVRQVKGRIPVIAGTGSNSTSEAADYSREAEKAGADACLLVTPYYNRPTQEGLYQHFSRIAGQVGIPLILYNVPARTACDLLPETVARLAEQHNLLGIKEATGDVDRARQVRALCGDAMQVYSGDDETALDLMLAGASGTVSVTANVVPAAMHQMAALAVSGQAEAARALNACLLPLHTRLFLESNPIPVKWALHRMGRIGAGIRLPLTQLSEAYHEPVLEALRLAGVQDATSGREVSS